MGKDTQKVNQGFQLYILHLIGPYQSVRDMDGLSYTYLKVFKKGIIWGKWVHIPSNIGRDAHIEGDSNSFFIATLCI